MPFKFRLGRARHYNVSTKNSYVVCVHLLDNTLKECTLSADSLGQECLDNIAQRIELRETKYFGLRYINKKLQYRWVELDKPLKKQLEKYALEKHAHSPMLYFGVMFYVANAASLMDEMTRYQYYLQLKTDVIDGKPLCTEDQAVRLATYSVQVEFGDHDPVRHTPDFFKDLVLLPRTMTADEATLAKLTQSIVGSHHLLAGNTPAAVELQYIVEAQQLGYGLEYYPAKDESGNEFLLGPSFVGVFVKPMNNSQPAHYFKWSAITNLINNKKVFGIETSLTEQTIQYHMETPDMAKYVFKMCGLQHKFYQEHKHMMEPDKEVPGAVEEGSTGPMPDLQQTVVFALGNEEDNLDSSSNSGPGQHVQTDVVASVLSQQEEYFPPTQVTVDTSPSDIQYPNGNIYTVSQQQQQQQQDIQVYQTPATPQPQQPQHMFTTPQQQQSVNNYQNSATGRVTPVVPAYRPSPDYETVMRSRMERLAQQQNLEQINNVANISHAQVYTHPETMAYSQPEIGYTQYMNQPSRPYSHSVYGNGMVDSHLHHIQYRPVDRSSSLIIHPTYSTPELTSGGLANQFSTSENMMTEALINQYKPPPPYPRPSSSTPDLATQTLRTYMSSSPDLVSRKNISNAALVEQSRLDQSMENLAFESQKLHVGGQQGPIQGKLGHPINEPALRNTPIMDHLLQSNQQEMGMYDNTTGENIYVNTAGSGDYANVSAIIANESGQNQHYIHYNEQLAAEGNMALFNQQHETQGSGGAGGVSRQFSDPSQVALQSQQTQHQVVAPNMSQLSGLDNSGFHSGDNGSDTIDCLDSSSAQRGGPYIDHRHNSSLDSSFSHDSRMFPLDSETEEDKANKRLSMGPLKMAAMNGLSISRASVLDPTPYENRAPKDERRKTLETKLEEGQVLQEFEQIPKKAAKCDCSLAGSVENRDRNRFKDVHPYNHNRVKIQPTKDNPQGYINASHVKMTVKADTWRYLAAQGPLAGTVRDFWAMVWEHGVDVIAMLTGVVENGRQKCHQYWPEKQGPKNKVKFGEWEVHLKFSNDSGHYVTRGLKLKHVPSKQERLVWQLQYTDWPDHGCPEDTQGFIAYLDEIESVHRHIMSEKPDLPASPILVHCSAGVGRSGVVVLTEIMKTCLEHNVNVDVPTVLGHLRAQRMYMVQTMSQYSFVYKTLVQFLNNSRLI